MALGVMDKIIVFSDIYSQAYFNEHAPELGAGRQRRKLSGNLRRSTSAYLDEL